MSVSELAKAIDLKRPAIYHALETLEKKGMISILGTEKILRYRAEPPEQLRSLLTRRETELERLKKKVDKAIPLFPTANEIPEGEAGIEFFRGTEGIKNLAERSLDNKDGELLGIIPSFDYFLAAFTKEFAAKYIEEKRDRNIVTRSVWAEPLKNEKEFKKHVTDHSSFFREIKYAPKEIKEKYRSIILIWDDKVAVINAISEVFGILITSKDYSDTMKALWHVLWSTSKIPSK